MAKSIRKLPQHCKDCGFTMIELMVTVLILGILTTVALPSFRELIINQRIKSASFDLMSAINQARSEAIRRNGQVTVTPSSSDWTKGWTVSTNVPTATTLNSQAVLNGLSITCYNTPPTAVACSAINFSGNGRITNTQSQSILISSTAIPNPKMTCISIDLSGLPKSKKTNC